MSGGSGPVEAPFSLKVAAEERYASAVTALVEQAGKVFGMPDAELGDLVGATGEVFAYIVASAVEAASIEVRCFDGIHKMTVDFGLEAHSFRDRFAADWRRMAG